MMWMKFDMKNHKLLSLIGTFGAALFISSTSFAQSANDGAATEGKGKRYLTLDDAAVSMAKAYQRGEKAKPIMSDDGKVVFAFGQSMPKLTCSPTRACDLEMQAGEKINKVILGDKVNWTWGQAESVEKGQPVQHVVVQPRDNQLETNAIITTDRRTYHVKLYAPKQEGVYLNRVGFYYPDELVAAWQYQEQASTQAKAVERSQRITDESFSPENMDFDYKISGSADFRPTRVFNTGKKVWIEIPKVVFEAGELPVLVMIDEENKANVVPYHVKRPSDANPQRGYFVVDKLFTRAELRVADEKVGIVWSKKAGWRWGS